MAINIYQGGSKARIGSPAAASASTRAQNAKAALATVSSAPAEVSDSGNTAVKKEGVLKKVGNFIGKGASVVSKFLPGVGGLISKGISKIFNDPEWWQSVPGEAVTLNNPLRLLSRDSSVQDGEDLMPLVTPKVAIAEFVSTESWSPDTSWDSTVIPGGRGRIMLPTVTAVNQYLIPQIRKVVNAIPLQTAQDYTDVLSVNASIYAFWRQLKKMDYMVKHGQTYLPSTDDVMFPMLQVENAPTFTSLMNRCEEYLRANVRLPHTLCEYLAWRYGRIYKSNSSKKSGLIMYNVLSLAHSVETYVEYLNTAMAYISVSTARQKANADLYNVYYDHDYMVEIKDETQFAYDMKEFCLRTNLDVVDSWKTDALDNPNPVYIDSDLDNPTTFMASTVSTIGRTGSGTSSEVSVLFPVGNPGFYLAGWNNLTNDQNTALYFAREVAPSGQLLTLYDYTEDKVDYDARRYFVARPHSRWAMFSYEPCAVRDPKVDSRFLTALMCMKALDVYNKDLYIKALYPGAPYDHGAAIDFTALSMDSGDVPDTIIANEHVFAFANLVDINRKTSMSYAKAEKLIAKDTAELIDKLDVAAPATVAVPATKPLA